MWSWPLTSSLPKLIQFMPLPRGSLNSILIGIKTDSFFHNMVFKSLVTERMNWQVNSLDSKTIIVVHRSWYTGCWWVGCYIWYSKKGTGRAVAPPSPLLTVPNVTAHPSTANVLITVLLYDGSLLCGFNVAKNIMPPPASLAWQTYTNAV